MKQEEFTSIQWAEYFEAREQKYFDFYQQSGEAKYDRLYYKYQKIAEAFRAKAREEGEREADIQKRMINMQADVDRLLPSKMYSRDEVEKLLRKAVWW